MQEINIHLTSIEKWDCSNSSSELSVDVAVTANRNRVCAVDLTQLTSCNAHIQHRQVIFICAEIVTRGQ